MNGNDLSCSPSVRHEIEQYDDNDNEEKTVHILNKRFDRKISGYWAGGLAKLPGRQAGENYYQSWFNIFSHYFPPDNRGIMIHRQTC
jgi:hypothetical protein